MKRTIFVGPLACLVVLAAAQACSSDDDPSSSSNGSTSSSTSSSGSTTSGGASSTSSSSSGETETNQCAAAGGLCVCGPVTLPCPSNDTVRDGTKKCPQGPQGSGACPTTCCLPGDGGALPPVDSGSDAGGDAG